VTLTAIADSYTVESDPSGNRGTRTNIGIAGASIGSRQYGFIKFNLGNIPDGSTITKVELKLYSYWHDNPSNAETWLGLAGESWSETGITWNSQPGATSGLSIYKTFSTDGYHTWSSSSHSSLISVVQEWVNGNKSNYGFFLTREQGYPGDTAYRASEYGTSAQRPRLIVTYVPPPDPDLIVSSFSPDSNPVNNTFYVGDSISWKATVKNIDEGTAGSSEVGYYIGTASNDLSTPLGSDPTDSINELDFGETDSERSVYAFTTSDVGQRYVICKADNDDEIDESNESNNIKYYGPFNVVAPSYTVSYDANNSTSGFVPASQNKTYDVSLTLRTNTGNLAREGYTFAGWNTNLNGTGTDYEPGGSYSANANVTLYAKWIEATTYTVTYNANNATSGSAPASQTKTHDESLTLRTNTGDLARTGYSFDGWNTNSSGTGTSYAEGDTYNFNATVILYAKWVEAPTCTYSISPTSGSFSASGGNVLRLNLADPPSPKITDKAKCRQKRGIRLAA